MLPDNRLDFITNIDPQFIDMMIQLRQDFIMLDEKLRIFSSLEPFNQKEGVARCLSLSRTKLEEALTKLEEALHYGIKSLYIMGEVAE